MKKLYMAILALLLTLSLGLTGCGGEASPQKETKPDYGYTLTQQQQDNYQSAVSHILKREGENLYRVQYRDCGVTLSEGRLMTNYDGKAVEVSSGSYACYPVMDLHGGWQEGLNGTGSNTLTALGTEENPYGDISGWRYMIHMENADSTPTFAAMIPLEDGADAKLLSGEATGMPDLSEYSEILFYNDIYYQTVRDEDGRLLPPQEWIATDAFVAENVPLVDGLSITYTPLKNGDYYVIYVVTDKQGNTYCSELIPYETEKEAPIKVQPELFVKWEKGERQVELLEENGVTVYLSVEKNSSGDAYYGLEVKNNTQAIVHASGKDVLLNEMYNSSWIASVKVEPGKTVAREATTRFGVVRGALETLNTMQLTVTVYDYQTGKTLINKTVCVDMSEAWPIKEDQTAYFHMDEPTMNALAAEQVLLENDQLKLTLVGIGDSGKGLNEFPVVLKLENRTQQDLTVNVESVVLNGAAISAYGEIQASAGCTAYELITIYDYEVGECTNASIETVSLLVAVEGPEDWLIPSVKAYCIPIELTQSGKAETFETGEELWTQDGFGVSQRGYDEKYDRWELTFLNDTQKAVCLYIVDMATGKEHYEDTLAGPGQYALREYDNENSEGGDMTVRFRIYDYETDELLLESGEVVLKAE